MALNLIIGYKICSVDVFGEMGQKDRCDNMVKIFVFMKVSITNADLAITRFYLTINIKYTFLISSYRLDTLGVEYNLVTSQINISY